MKKLKKNYNATPGSLQTPGFSYVTFQSKISTNLTINSTPFPEQIILKTFRSLSCTLCHPKSMAASLNSSRGFLTTKLVGWVCHRSTFRGWEIRGLKAEWGKRKLIIASFRLTLADIDDDQWPVLVVEVGVSQSLPQLQRDAIWWFRQSLDVTYVLLVDIDKGQRTMTVQKWERCRPRTPQLTRNGTVAIRRCQAAREH